MLAVGILNRIMKVEMGLGLGLVSLVIGAHYFAAPLAIPLGHYSDRRSIRGYHRTPYILAGTLLTMVATLACPFVALHLEGKQGSLVPSAIALGVFLVLGVGIYTTGTTYLSLIADLTPEKERGRAVSVVWSMMMVGIPAGVFLGVGVLDYYAPASLIRLFAIVAAVVGLLTLLAVWGQERPEAARPSSEAVVFRLALRVMTGTQQTRLFFLFLAVGILLLFLQQVVLEPFGGDVFGMSVRQTTLFNAYQMTGVLAGMALAGRWLTRRIGDRWTAGLGPSVASLSFAVLGLASLFRLEAMVAPGFLGMGLGMGFFNVGGLAMMMGMAARGSTGLYMGIWTLAQALANGLASIGGGAIFDLSLGPIGTEAAAYAAVFLIEAVGLAAVASLLGRLSVREFHRQTAALVAAYAGSG